MHVCKLMKENTRYADIKNKTFLVTGGAGFIGSHLADYLLRNGAKKVRVLDNFSTGSKENIQPFLTHSSLELIEGDIRDIETCRQVTEGIEYVLHQAALGSVPRSIEDPLTTNEVNINGFLNILLAAKDAGVKRMVYAASSSTYGDEPALPKVEDRIGKPLSPYAITKYVNELYGDIFSKLYGFHTIGLRYFNVFGPKQNLKGPYAAVIPLFIKAALNAESPYINGDGENSRDFTYIDNVMQANIKALFAPVSQHEVFNIACGQSTSLKELWRNISQIMQSNIEPRYRNPRAGDVKHSRADISKAGAVLKYFPEVDVNEGLSKTCQWYRDNRGRLEID